MKPTILQALVICLAASAANAADVTWPGGSGDLASAAAWGRDVVPGASDKVFVCGTGSWSLTASGNFAAGHLGVYPDNGPLTLNVDLGEHAWTGAWTGTGDWGHRFILNGKTDYPLSIAFRGVYSSFTGLGIGVNANGYGGSGFSNAAVEFTGEGTSFTGGNEDTQVGVAGTNNALIVSGGAHVASGRALCLGSAAGSNNRFRVTGAGSVFTSRGDGNYNKIGNASSGNTVEVEDGARFEQATSSFFAIGAGVGACNNTFSVSGGTVDVAGASSFFVGYGTDNFGNKLSVSNSSFSAYGLYVGHASGCAGNEAHVGGGSAVNTRSHVAIGSNAASSGNLLAVEGEGTVFSNQTYDVTVGEYGLRNVLRVKGGAGMWTQRALYVGAKAGAADNMMEVSGEGSWFATRDNQTVVGGAGATNNAFLVAGGAMFTNNNARVNIGDANAVSNSVAVDGSGTGFFVGNYVTVGLGGGASGNRFTVSGGAYAELARGFLVGAANGACSNVVEILDGAVVDTLKDYSATTTWQTYLTTGPQSTADGYDDATIVGNGIVVSNASLIATGPSRAPEFLVNYRGTGGYLKALDGAFVCPNQSFSLGCGSKNASHGLIYAAGEGTVLSNRQYHLRVGYGNSGGHDNTVWIENGAKMYIQKEMHFGSDSVPSATNNCIKIVNGEFYNSGSDSLWLYNHSRLVWGGSRSQVRISTLRVTNGGRMRFEFDEDGIAPFGPLHESYLLTPEFVPTVDEIVIDASKYVKNPANSGRRTFAIYRSENNRNVRTSNGLELSAQSQAVKEAVNEAFRARIRCIPGGCVSVTKVDMVTSTIEVAVKVPRGMIITFR